MRARTFARHFLKVLVSAMLLAFLFSKISVTELLTVVQKMDRRILLSAIAVFFASNVLGSCQWFFLLTSSGVRLRYTQAFRFYFVGLFFNNFLPANIGGDAVKVYDVSRFGVSVYQVVAVTLIDRLVGIFALCLLATAAVIWLNSFYPVDSLGLYLAIFVGCMLPVVGFYLVEPLGRMLRWLVRLVRSLAVDERGTAIIDHMGDFKEKKSFIIGLTFFSFLIQSMRVMTHVLVAHALGVPLDTATVVLFFVFVPLLSLAMIPPITINGLGIREALGIVLLAQAGIGRTDAFAVEFVTYLISVVVSLLGLFIFLLRRDAAREPKADPTAI